MQWSLGESLPCHRRRFIGMPSLCAAWNFLRMAPSCCLVCWDGWCLPGCTVWVITCTQTDAVCKVAGTLLHTHNLGAPQLLASLLLHLIQHVLQADMRACWWCGMSPVAGGRTCHAWVSGSSWWLFGRGSSVVQGQDLCNTCSKPTRALLARSPSFHPYLTCRQLPFKHCLLHWRSLTRGCQPVRQCHPRGGCKPAQLLFPTECRTKCA